MNFYFVEIHGNISHRNLQVFPKVHRHVFTSSPAIAPTPLPGTPTETPSRRPTNTRAPTKNPVTSAPTLSRGYQPAVCQAGPLQMNSDREVAFIDVCTVWESLKVEWDAKVDSFPNKDTDIKFLDMIGSFLRLVFHDAGEFDQNTSDLLGADGCLAIVADNAGLLEEDSPVFTIAEVWWQNFACTKMSRADFWTMVGNLLIRKVGAVLTNPIFDYGRSDQLECSAGDHRLPEAQGGMNVLNRVFVNQMGLTLDDAGNLTI